MARIRSIKPDFWTDEKIVELDPWDRLLFIGLWNFADDQGYIDDSPKRIKMQVFPGDDVDVSRGLARLTSLGLIQRYASAEGRILHLANWEKHQRVSNPAKPRFAPSDLHECDPEVESSEALPSPLEDSRVLGKGREGKGREETFSSAKPPRQDVEHLCNLLADLVEGNGSKRPVIGKGWRDAARLMLDRDNRDPHEAERLIRWCQADQFWHANVLSMPTFREQYDKLRLKAGTQPLRAVGQIDLNPWRSR